MKASATKAVSLVTIAMLVFGLFGTVVPFKTTETASLTDGLVAYWNFDEVSGKTAYDSANGNDSTLQRNATRSTFTMPVPVIPATFLR